MPGTAASPTGFPRVGIMGGGQLGRMLALAGIRMGIQIRFLNPVLTGSIATLGEAVVGDWDDPDILCAFAEGCDAITVESEWAPIENLTPFVPRERLLPSPDTLLQIRDKGIQKQTLADAGLPTPAFARCESLEQALEAANAFGFPVMLKKYRGSYDGYGNATARTVDDVEAAWPRLADADGLLVEAWAAFVRELSVLVARRADGEHVVYPVAYTEQRDHRCHAVEVPAAIAAGVAAEAQRVGVAAVEAFGSVGVTAVELFELADGTVMVNEMAPRPHNTGHYTIEGSHTSQFENHLRAVLGWPLGDPSLRAPCAVMINVLGHRSGVPSIQGLDEALRTAGASIHLYGKETVEPRRKMGHVTVTGDHPTATRARAERAAAAIHL